MLITHIDTSVGYVLPFRLACRYGRHGKRRDIWDLSINYVNNLIFPDKDGIMSLYDRFVKKYGSELEDDDSFEQGLNSEVSDTPSKRPDPLYTAIVPGPKTELEEEVIVPKAPKVPAFLQEDDEDDDSFERGMEQDFPELEHMPSNLTPVVPKRAMSKVELVKLCELYYSLATK